MPVIDGVKFSCAPCMRGHRATSCIHRDRILLEVRKPGRPLSSCPHKLKNYDYEVATGSNLEDAKSTSKTKTRKIEKKPRTLYTSTKANGGVDTTTRCPNCSTKLAPNPMVPEPREGGQTNFSQRRSPFIEEVQSFEEPPTHQTSSNIVLASEQLPANIEASSPISRGPNLSGILPPISRNIIDTSQLRSTVPSLPSLTAHIVPGPYALDYPYASNFQSSLYIRESRPASLPSAMESRQLPPPYVYSRKTEDTSFLESMSYAAQNLEWNVGDMLARCPSPTDASHSRY